MFKKIIFIIILSSMVASCASGIAARKLMYRDHKTALFTLEEDEFSKKERAVLGAPFLHPIRNTTEENWKAILGNLRFKKESTVGNMIYPIFSEEELNDLARNIATAIKKVRNDQVLIVVSKFNDIKGVVSKDHRTTFAIFKNKDGINLIFRELHAGMPEVDATNYYEWSRIPDLFILKNFEIFRVEEEDYIRFAKSDDFENRLWILIDPEIVDSLEYTPRLFLEPEMELKDKDGNIEKKSNGKLPKSEAIINRDLD
ncbi:MAG: hypothetical protein JJT78_08860 [Leptospira sp.]|nr:hypothetical protein [Leptospira sp.]